METKQILLTGCYQYTKEQLKQIESLGYEITFVQNELEKLDIDVSIFDTVICNGLFLHNDISKFTNLKKVQVTAAGLDRLPLDYLNEHHIPYYNARGVYSIPLAEWVTMFILNIYKAYPFFMNNQKGHIWNKKRDLLELTNKTATIIGYGSVGKEIAKRLKVFGVKVQVVDIVDIHDEYVDRSYKLDQMDEVLPDSDMIILSIALTDATHHLMNEERLKLCKQDSTLINVARGPLVDEEALIKCSNRFLGIALDVFEKEPLDTNSKLWGLDNVVITPHNSFVSDQVKDRMFDVMMENIK